MEKILKQNIKKELEKVENKQMYAKKEVIELIYKVFLRNSEAIILAIRDLKK